MHKISFILFFALFLTSALVQSQKNDYTWLLGYGYSLQPNDTFGISVMDFNSQSLNPLIYFDIGKQIDFDGASVCMSDGFAKYIFSTNSKLIIDASNSLMLNGNDMDNSSNSFTKVIPQTILGLPTYENDHYILIHEFAQLLFDDVASIPLYYSIIDMKENNGLGKVVKKLLTFSQDTLELGKLTATRHANGRDWWIPIPSFNKDFIFTFLVQDTAIKLIRKQKVDSIIYNGYGQASFSPDGLYYSNISSISDQKGTYIYLYEFDRCSGLFTAIKQWHIDKALYHVGVAFSPDSKIFYFTFWPYIFQVDLLSQDKKIDTLAINDYYIEDIGGGFRRYNPFGFMQLGPDNRLYCVPNTESRNMHVINRPNILGSGAELKQHILRFASLHQTIPMHPNFRLGPVDGSPCDTLGINNIPVAEYRYDQDTSQYLKMEFTDLSYHEPKEWYWDFGDSNSSDNTSAKVNPIHTFSGNGVFDVCLIVKNQNGSDTICKLIKIGTVGTKNNKDYIPDIELSPNPFRDFFVVNVVDYNPQKMILSLYNSTGELVNSRQLYQGNNVINVDNLNPGLYFISILENGKEIKQDKLIKM